MAERSSSSLPTFLFITFLIVVAGLIFLMIRSFMDVDAVSDAALREAQMIEATFGTETLVGIRQAADEMSIEFMEANDVDAMIRSFGNTLAGIDNRLGDWTEAQIEALRELVGWVMMRIALFSKWLPVWGVVLALTTINGILAWQVKRTSFDMPSPLVYSTSITLFLIIWAVILLTFVMPWALEPYWVPLLLFLSTICVNRAIANLPKRM